jgi:hypothetical protein
MAVTQHRKECKMKTGKKYGFTDGAHVKGDPQRIGEALEQVRHKHKDLTSEGVVAEAKAKSSPLHDLFLWDDSEAAHKYRLVQARTLIRSITVIVEDSAPVRQYVHVRNTDPKSKRTRSGTYQPVKAVAQDLDSYQVALQELLEKLRAAERAVQELQEAAGKSRPKSMLAIIGTITESLQVAHAAVKKLPA